MRFAVELLLQNDRVPKDKNKIILSLLKSCFSEYDKGYYEALYVEEATKTKEFTFSLYMGNCQFLREEIVVPTKKMILNFSAYGSEDGIMFYNSFLSSKGKSYPIKDNTLTIGKITLVKEKPIVSNEVIFKTLNPICVREHEGDNKKTWYHSLNTEEGQAVFMKNLKHQLLDVFGERVLLDFEEIKLELPEDMREVKVKNYGIEILSNLGKLKIKAQPYILDYLYKGGVGSKRGSGFGMVDMV